MNSIEENTDELTSSIWGPPRKVVLHREANKSLGISIVGGKLDISTKSDSNESNINSKQKSFIRPESSETHFKTNRGRIMRRNILNHVFRDLHNT